jgi:hypothetical protein
MSSPVLSKFFTVDSVTFAEDLAEAIASSGGSGDANKIMMTNASGVLDSSFYTSGSGFSLVTTETANFNAVAEQAFLVDLNTAAGSVIATLPTAVGCEGQLINIEVSTIFSGAHVTIHTTSSQTVNGSAPTSLPTINAVGENLLFMSDGANWWSLNQILVANSNKIAIVYGDGQISIDVTQSNLSLSSIGGSLNLASQVGSSILPPANGGTGFDNTSANGHILIGNSTTGYADGTIGSSDSTISSTLGAGTLTLQVDQANLTLSNLGGEITAAQSFDNVTATNSSGSTIAAGKLVNLYNASGTLSMQLADMSTPLEADGWTTASVTNTSTGNVKLLNGINTNYSGLTEGDVYFLNTAGGVTAAPSPTSGQMLQRIGKAISATAIAVTLYPGKVYE